MVSIMLSWKFLRPITLVRAPMFLVNNFYCGLYHRKVMSCSNRKELMHSLSLDNARKLNSVWTLQGESLSMDVMRELGWSFQKVQWQRHKLTRLRYETHVNVTHALRHYVTSWDFLLISIRYESYGVFFLLFFFFKLSDLTCESGGDV